MCAWLPGEEGSLPGCEDLLVLQLLHPGGGGHRHGDHDVVDVEGALTAAPLDGLLLGHKTRPRFKSEPSNMTAIYTRKVSSWAAVARLTGVLGTLWLVEPSGTVLSDEVDSWRLRGL